MFVSNFVLTLWHKYFARCYHPNIRWEIEVLKLLLELFNSCNKTQWYVKLFQTEFLRFFLKWGRRRLILWAGNVSHISIVTTRDTGEPRGEINSFYIETLISPPGHELYLASSRIPRPYILSSSRNISLDESHVTSDKIIFFRDSQLY